MPLLTTRRALWLPGVAVLGAAVGIAALLGISVGTRSWAVYVFLVTAVLLGIGAIERVLERRRQPGPAKARGRLKVIRGGKDYDLADDDRTETQRFLM
jgi:hypothetical protein